MSVAAVVVASEIYLHGDNHVFTKYALIIKLPQTYSQYRKFSSHHAKFYLCTVGKVINVQTKQKVMTVNSLVMSYNWLETMESLSGNYGLHPQYEEKFVWIKNKSHLKCVFSKQKWIRLDVMIYD